MTLFLQTLTNNNRGNKSVCWQGEGATPLRNSSHILSLLFTSTLPDITPKSGKREKKQVDKQRTTKKKDFGKKKKHKKKKKTKCRLNLSKRTNVFISERGECNKKRGSLGTYQYLQENYSRIDEKKPV